MRLVVGLPFLDLRRLVCDPSQFRVSSDPQDWREQHSFAKGVGQVVARREGSPHLLPNDHLVFESERALRRCEPGPTGLSLLWRYLVLRGPLGWLEVGWRVESEARSTPARQLTKAALSASFCVSRGEVLPLSTALRRALDRYGAACWRGPEAGPVRGPYPLGSVVLLQGGELTVAGGTRAYGLPLAQSFEVLHGPMVRLLRMTAPVPSPRADDALVSLLRLHAVDEAMRELRRLARPGRSVDPVSEAAPRALAALDGEVRTLHGHPGHVARVRGWVASWVDLNPSGSIATELGARATAVGRAVRVFLSYSRHDRAARDTLCRLLAPLESDGTLVWHDGHLDVGDRFDDRIREELAQADIVVFLLSPEALATQYVRNVEIPAAVGLARDRGVLVLPVLWRDCLWMHTPLASFGILPEKAVSIAAADDPDSAWVRVAARLGGEIQKLVAARRP